MFSLLFAPVSMEAAAHAQPHNPRFQITEPGTASSQAQVVESGVAPAGLSGSDWAGIQAQIAVGKYRAYPGKDGGFVSSNPAHGWRLHFASDGATKLKPRDRGVQAYHLGLRLSAVGYSELQAMDHPQQVTAGGFTVSYRWNGYLSERWVNSETGLEQWFELDQRPPGAQNGAPLTLEMTLATDLAASQNGNALVFINEAGTSISYDKLRVWDSTGVEIPATMHLRNDSVSLLVDDRSAIYPLTIDPSFKQQAYLKASNTGAGDQFGQTVAISGDTVVVGAYQEDSNAKGINGDQSNDYARDSGAAYIFTRSAGVWSQQAYLKASNAARFDEFGRSVAVSGDTVVVGAAREASNATGVNGNEADNSASYSGAVYVFKRSGASWSQQAYLKASNTGAGDQFGYAVAISGDTLLVSAPFEDSNATGVNGNGTNNLASSAGAAYVFKRSGSAWSQQAYLKASNTDSGDAFGYAVAVSGDALVVGAQREDSNAKGVNGNGSDNSASYAGAAYVFARTGSVWSQQAYLKASNSEVNDEFGRTVAISGDTVVVGAYAEDSNATGSNGNQNDGSMGNSGAAYVFKRTGSSWSQQAYLKASNTGAGDQFGSAVAISGDLLVVGSDQEASNATGVNGNEANNSVRYAGAAYVFKRAGSAWSQQAYLKASNTGMDDRFGQAVAISGNSLVVGAFGESSSATGIDGNGADNSAGESGAAYVFYLDTDTGSGPSYTVGGSVSGLAAGNSVILQNNGVDDEVVSVNGNFTFATELQAGSTYSVTVRTQPTTPSQTCTVTNGSGTMPTANVTSVRVSCVVRTFTVGGTVSGLSGSGLVLQNNFGNDLPIGANGGFTFTAALFDGSGYSVRVKTQPTNPGQSCTVTNGNGTISGANVTNVSVNCATQTFTVGGNVTELAGSGLVLQNNAGDDLAIGSNGSFTFDTALADGSGYSVSVKTQPANPGHRHQWQRHDFRSQRHQHQRQLRHPDFYRWRRCHRGGWLRTGIAEQRHR
jgi:hypothetical protein